MSFRGRGRGRGNFGRFAKEEKFEVFPEITELPDVNLEQKEKLKILVQWGDDLHRVWNSSPYYLVDTSEGGKNKGSITKRPPLSDYIKMSSDYVPAELAGKHVNVKPSKKPKWDFQSVDLQKLDAFVSMDKRAEAQDEEKKEDEEEDEDNENVEEEEVESDDDYAQGQAYDDDEDDYNVNEDFGDDEGCY